MLKIVSLVMQKGGPGKTTLTASLAVAAAQAGHGVVVIDIDRQKSLRAWNDRRQTGDHEATVRYRAIEDEDDPKRELSPEEVLERLDPLLAAIRTHAPTTRVLIDTPGHRNLIADIGIDVADFAVVPVRPGIMDYDPVRDTVLDLTLSGKPFAFVLNQVDARRSVTVEDAIGELSPMGTICPEFIGLRPAEFADSMILGQGVTEYRPRGQGAEEVRRLWSWIDRQLQGGNGNG